MSKKYNFFILFICLLLLFSVPAYASTGTTEDESHWYDAFGWFGDIANFVKYLVVPPENYFHNRLSLLNNMVNEKFGGLGQLYQTLNDFFKKLSNPSDVDLNFRLPNNFLFSGSVGMSFDMLAGAKPYISFFRSVLTAAFFIFTVIVCYHKLRTFFTEGES